MIRLRVNALTGANLHCTPLCASAAEATVPMSGMRRAKPTAARGFSPREDSAGDVAGAGQAA